MVSSFPSAMSISSAIDAISSSSPFEHCANDGTREISSVFTSLPKRISV